MATLKMGSTTMLTESSGALTINASNPTVTLGSNTTFPAGHVVQVKRIYLKGDTSDANMTYSTSGSALNGTLDGNGIYRLKNADSEYLTIPSFSATSGNLLIAWVSYLGIGGTASACNFSYGIEWGSAALRTYASQGYNNVTYTHGHSFMTSTVLGSSLNSVNVHALLRMEEQNKTQYYRFHINSTDTTNWGTEGDSDQSCDISMTIMEIQQ
jgi:hypothetical protein